MIKYEYQYELFQTEPMDAIIKTLNEKGSHGWRVVSEKWIDSNTVGYLLERPVTEKSALFG